MNISRNKSLALTSTVLGLVCGWALSPKQFQAVTASKPTINQTETSRNYKTKAGPHNHSRGKFYKP
ncbi:hypothetical protein HU830_00960 [Lactobacillus sp. DCY120]|uniref:Uncharacterized protein n=1 Tax=Bombilactobacillus apium TaxID=2675299 RepID=A0A850R0A3_9LACO|nr:hypothetical protein [Bombilactobacillus apium]NVY95780.1 hypothetical protein [Bombilactobacillus apium]